MSRRGELESLLPTELAYPRGLGLYRLLNGEALYYGREGAHDRPRELAYIVTQLGVWQRGDGEVLSRVLTLALGEWLSGQGYEVYQSFVGSEWTLPQGLSRPRDVQRVLHYRDEGEVLAVEMLDLVSAQLRRWRSGYGQRRLVWVLGEWWDVEGCGDHVKAYSDLSGESDVEAWWIRVGEGDVGCGGAGFPEVSRYMGHNRLLSTSLLWQ